MKLVVDSNVLFTFFWEKSTSRELFLRQDLELFSPELAIHEIDKYAQDIMRKAKLSKSEFEMSEIAKCAPSRLQSGVSIRRFLSMLKNHSPICLINHATRFSGWFLTGQKASSKYLLGLSRLKSIRPFWRGQGTYVQILMMLILSPLH